MSWRWPWVVLVSGDAAWVEKRTHEILEEEGDGREYHFMIIPGQGRYHAIVEKGRRDVGPEMLLGRILSLECEEPVFAIQGVDEFSYVSRFLKGEETAEDQEPDELVRSLGCVPPWVVESPKKPQKPTRTAALIQGLSAQEVLTALEKEEGRSLPPGYYHMVETPRGVLLGEGAGWLSSALNHLAHRFPRATVYSVTATPNLDFFVVFMTQKRKTVQFAPPPQEATYYPAIQEVMGERTPERILSALGIPKEWFHL